MTNISQVSKDRGARRPAQGYARGDATRLHIVETAIEVFGSHGFEDASTRLIARRAGVNLAALHYYFGGKRELYRACAEHLAGMGEARVAPFLALMDQPDASHEAQLELLHRLLDAFADRLVGPRDPPAMVAFFLREQIAPTEAYDILHQRVMAPLMGACTSVVGRLLGRPADAEETVLRTLAIMAPLMLFQRAREVALRTLHWPDFEGERLVRVKALVRQQAQTMVGKEGPGGRERALPAASGKGRRR
ncbi:MAG TPA: CerR family C-terminal domain-containing protein [Acetobacteraceae bacterium]|jgi:AcrR family transcriptional regulator|nr:CerR family C-terminal domain-containing protein [Acetobacteraceae bacterium]